MKDLTESKQVYEYPETWTLGYGEPVDGNENEGKSGIKLFKDGGTK